jgi:D-serine deaminase-like pyridoxal phosphate-dependent protein
MTFLDSITVPTLLVDEGRCRRNLRRMADKASASGVRFRPHFKTHQSARVGDWCREAGVEAITVSSLRMASYFADHGWRDITVAFPVNLREIDTLRRLAGQVHLGVILDSPEVAAQLVHLVREPLNVWIEVDTGDERSGVAWDDPYTATLIAGALRGLPSVTLRGVLTHAGRSYSLRSPEAIRGVYHETVNRLNAVRAALAAAGSPGLMLSLGDTPCCSLVEDFSAVDEIRPGNFAYYDVMQAVIGACQVEDIAIAVACPVVSKNAIRHQLVVYGGAVHLSKDTVVDRHGRVLFGLVTRPVAEGWGAPLANTYVRSLSQEHGVIQTDAATFEQVRIGEVLMILPVHSCLTADLLKAGHTLRGDALPMLHLSHPYGRP